MEIKKRLFGQTKTGEAVFAFTLKNSVGTEVTILTVLEICGNRCGAGL